MKLLRYGPADQERPDVLDSAGTIRDLSDFPEGFEEYLPDVFSFLQATVLREPTIRTRFSRPT